MKSITSSLLLIVLLQLSIVASAQSTTLLLSTDEPDSTSAIFDLREAERNFAKASAMFGKKKAFVDNFADTSIFYIGHWVKNGRQIQIDSENEAIFLKWEPEFMDISESRDFGISYGPWERQEYRPYTDAISNGYYFTVWELNTLGVWKVKLDCGILTPKDEHYNHVFKFPKGLDKPEDKYTAIDTKLTCKTLEDLDNNLNKGHNNDNGYNKYIAHLAPGFIMLKGNHLPSSDIDSIKTWINTERNNIWELNGSGAAKSGDIGYTYGIKINNGAPIPWGYYVRVWRKQKDGTWKMTLELS